MTARVDFIEMINFTVEMKEKAIVKITRVEKIGFNDMEGNQFLIGFKMTLINENRVFSDNKKRSRLFESFTNATYIGDYMENYESYNTKDVKKELQEYIDCL